ncbi:hypothetical protein TGME49_311040 [Toxoplasma gondii ME49]|uniref:Uncharacterized protein n=2 Tax=Toxoplasma gondii TaxID=5811 RepID=B6KAH0_TOXGV|nr:hypothetical protein TGME49_311040 [Toxoplasma gondii ME49]EPT26127.1 hypothetical protein TGME49_311040 [Toxoplasma gondii ME49]ESS34923.1 hypothetical protein TGVEG_311040 [Toxoplasma gondii VEG]CEL77397.1 TPA: hypothetical protein BN1205_095130 [Toxoplasma gondii VEG]|eukprot:XP_002364348.1 hypothetical protein TGME49_311040 [Toxoplasma gondii ME49]
MATHHHKTLHPERQGQNSAKRLFAWTEHDDPFVPLHHGDVSCPPASGSASHASRCREASTRELSAAVDPDILKRRRLLGPDVHSRLVSEEYEGKAVDVAGGSRLTTSASTGLVPVSSHVPSGAVASPNHGPIPDESEELSRTSSVSSVEVDMMDAGGGSPPRQLAPTLASRACLAYASRRNGAKEPVSERRSADTSLAPRDEKKNENCYAIMPFLSETAAQIPRPLGEGDLSLEALLQGTCVSDRTRPLSEMIRDPEVARLLRDQPADPLESLERNSEGFLLTEVLRKKREQRLKKALQNTGRMAERGVSLRALYDLCESDEETRHERRGADGRLSPSPLLGKDTEDASMD